MNEHSEITSVVRFVEGDNDTVIDCSKKLVWLKQDTWQFTGKWMNQLQVKEFAETLNIKRFAGFSNWRLPTANEAKSLFDKSKKTLITRVKLFSCQSCLPRGVDFFVGQVM